MHLLDRDSHRETGRWGDGGRGGGSDRQQLSTNRWNSLKKCVKKKTRKFMLKLTET